MAQFVEMATETGCYVYPPNRPMSIIFEPQTRPTIYNDLLCMDLNGPRLLLSSCNVTSTFWEGSLQIFADFEAYLSQQHEAFYNGGIISSAKFISNDCVLVAESEAKLIILAASESDQNEPRLQCKYSTDNCELVKQLALWPGGETSALALSDAHVTLWDLAEDKLQIVTDYTNYHTAAMNSIDANKHDRNVFATASLDRRVCVWDTRMKICAMELYNNSFCSATSVAWSYECPNSLVAGTHSGNVYLLDTKQPKEFVNVQSCYKKRIFKLEFNSESKLAVVGDTNELQVYTCKNGQFQLCYTNTDQHKRFIRDVKWNGNDLYTCGIHSQIIKHTV